MIYSAIYFGMGAFLVVVALLHNGLDRDKRLVGAIGMIVLWPIILLVGPESLSSLDRRPNDQWDKRKDTLKDQLAPVLGLKSHPDFGLEEISRLTRVARKGYEDVSTFTDDADFQDILARLWEIGLHPRVYRAFKQASWRLDESYDPDDEREIRFSLREPDWYVGFSNEFVRSISKVDRKVQGRILKALGDISLAPTQPVGDTIKPLTGELKGLWRYRLGDDRLVYFPDQKAKTIVLIFFSSRGDVYTDLPDVSGLVGKSEP